ncbi:hypothetical protein BDW74DRAFT_143271 [Aspergillus multicolor]|uniref:uncharacterized protein n=1 Tax=Aspergillus multicolor TaxID=41759 RepID=UPI003CCCE57E
MLVRSSVIVLRSYLGSNFLASHFDNLPIAESEVTAINIYIPQGYGYSTVRLNVILLTDPCGSFTPK